MASKSAFPNDPRWPRAGRWIRAARPDQEAPIDLGIIGIPAFKTSISPTGANRTPGAVRDALMRFTTYASSRGVDVNSLQTADFGDVSSPDGPDGEDRVKEAVRWAAERCELLIILGGDNSITYSSLRGISRGRLAEWGLITLDAHHDLRDGVTNGSSVQRLIEDGLPGKRTVQIGIADFSNSSDYAARAREHGITVVTRDSVREKELESIASKALTTAGNDSRQVFVDLDVDVCDRSVAPACPASVPGGLSADDIRQMTYLLAKDERVRAIDITEVDATADAPDGRTVRLAALLILEAATGLASR